LTLPKLITGTDTHLSIHSHPQSLFTGRLEKSLKESSYAKHEARSGKFSFSDLKNIGDEKIRTWVSSNGNRRIQKNSGSLRRRSTVLKSVEGAKTLIPDIGEITAWKK